MHLDIRDEVATIAQPVRRLRGFQRVTLAPGASQTVTFTLGAQDLGFYTNSYSAQLLVEPGVIDVFVGNTSANDNGTRLTLTWARRRAIDVPDADDVLVLRASGHAGTVRFPVIRSDGGNPRAVVRVGSHRAAS